MPSADLTVGEPAGEVGEKDAGPENGNGVTSPGKQIRLLEHDEKVHSVFVRTKAQRQHKLK